MYGETSYLTQNYVVLGEKLLKLPSGIIVLPGDAAPGTSPFLDPGSSRAARVPISIGNHLIADTCRPLR
jgi:hypothetical protein